MRLTPDAVEVLSPARDEMKMCAFMWVYYGYPNSNYEGMNVEVMRYRNGAIMARDEAARGGRGVFLRQLRGGADVLFRHNENVRRGLGVDVAEGEHVVVFIDLAAADFAARNLAENTIIELHDA